jgi:hypothetical protein
MPGSSTTPRVLLLHHKELKLVDYLVEYTDLKSLEASGLVATVIESLPQQNAHLDFARLPEKVRRLLFFAKPDLLVCYDDGAKPIQPIFAIDLTEHVAARDHWIQRFPNLVGCAQEGVPGVFIAPRDTPNRPNFIGKTDPFFFFAYDRVIEIHQTPIYIAEWTSADGHHLDRDTKFRNLPKHDSPDLARVFSFFNVVLDTARRGGDLGTLMRDRMLVDLRNELRRLGYSKSNVPKISDFDRLTYNMPTGEYLSQAQLASWLKSKSLALPADAPDRIVKREHNLIFAPMSGNATDSEKRKSLKSRIKHKGGDPYTQQPLLFDYLFCRLGPDPSERDANLVVDLSVLEFEDFAEYVSDTWKRSPLQYTDFADVKAKIPIYTLHLGSGLGQVMKNFIRLYAFSADLIVFKDGVLYF